MFIIFLHSESRGAASLLATAQLNQRRPPSPQPPQLPGQMMSNDRAIRVRTKKNFLMHIILYIINQRLMTVNSSHFFAGRKDSTCIIHVMLLLIFQLNYEYLRKCVASGPVTPMPPEAWERIVKLLPLALRTSPLTSPMLPQLHRYNNNISLLD